ncbi:MAG: glycine cleavage system aminomethyltransferase GcvT [Halobacteriovoraceae bacterium]|nr:glycine cleavage system aminomethyltransferase GcvT [Halobacteriovoraceae bacterium]
MNLKKTSLFEEHVKLNAKMVPFAGYSMPVQYTSVKNEVYAVRNNCGVFDVSHMGEFFVTGKDAISFVDYLMTNSFASVPMNKAVYSPLCRHDGTIIDDFIAYKLTPERVLLCVNASNIEKDWKWITSVQNEKQFDIELINSSAEYSLLAVQGSKTIENLEKIGLEIEHNLPYYSATEGHFQNSLVIIARTGYTGEDGFEIFIKNEMVETIWKKLIENKVIPCGLAARDVLRLEVCYPLYGHELSDDVLPNECNLNWTIKPEGRDFIGKNSILNSQQRSKLVKISLDKGIPREGYPVTLEDKTNIGVVTSGTMSPTLNKGIALARLNIEKFDSTKPIFVDIRGKLFPAKIQVKPFYVLGAK